VKDGDDGGTLVLFAEEGFVSRILINDQPRENYRFTRDLSVIPSETEGRGQSQKVREPVARLLQQLWNDERGQDIAEYAVMLAVILVIVVGTIRLIGSNANNVFSSVGSAIQ
jgi:Flp pilus assembly pilin Flp